MWHQISWSLKKPKQVSHINTRGEHYEIVNDFTVEPVVQCDVLAVKNTSLDDDNDDCK